MTGASGFGKGFTGHMHFHWHSNENNRAVKHIHGSKPRLILVSNLSPLAWDLVIQEGKIAKKAKAGPVEMLQSTRYERSHVYHDLIFLRTLCNAISQCSQFQLMY